MKERDTKAAEAQPFQIDALIYTGYTGHAGNASDPEDEDDDEELRAPYSLLFLLMWLVVAYHLSVSLLQCR